MDKKPDRGDVWLVNLNPTLGREQRGIRPCLVISATPLNHGPADLAVVLPITTTGRGIPSHVRLVPPEGGVRKISFVKCEDIRSVSRSARLLERWGRVTPGTLEAIEMRLRMLLAL